MCAHNCYICWSKKTPGLHIQWNQCGQVKVDLKQIVTSLTVWSRQHYTSQRQDSVHSQRWQGRIQASNCGTHQPNFPQVRNMKQRSSWDDWIAKGAHVSFNSRLEQHSTVNDKWWAKSLGSHRWVINGDRYTTWETGWEGKKIIYKRIVNSCTHC